MTWTTTPPTEPGYYWLKEHYGADPVLVEVCASGVVSAPRALFAYRCGVAAGDLVSDEPAWAEWCGPIVPPG